MSQISTTSRQTIWIRVVAILLALHMLTTPFAVYLQLYDSGPTWLGLDDSARMALNFAWKEDLNWGYDFIYTYGPLSFLSTKVGWGVSHWAFLAIDVFVAANFAVLFQDFISRSASRPLAAVAVFLLTLAIPVFYGSGLAWVLLAFIYYWMHRSYMAPRWWHFGMLAILITLAFYLKLNTGLFTIVFLLGHLLLLVFAKKISPLTSILVMAALGVLIWLCSLAFHVSLPAYIKGAAEVVKGYNDLLYLYESHPTPEAQILALFFGLCALIVAGSLAPLRRRQYGAVFLLAISAAYLFLLKKQGLFRNDQQHLGEFFAYAPLVFFTGIAGYLFPQRSRLVLAGICAVTLACVIFGAGERPLAPLGERVVSRYTVVYRYIREAAGYDPANYLTQQHKRYIPERTLQRIGQGTVDVFPWDANYAFENRLRYTPRPCFQTFQANSDYLQRVNLEFYQQRGPQFVLYDYDAIDGAYPFNDAPTLNLFLARAYKVADSFTSNGRWRILLEKISASSSPIRLEAAGSRKAALNAPIPAATPYLRPHVSYTIRGKLRAIWDRPAPLQIAYLREDGSWQTHKTSPELLKTGLYTGHLIANNEDFARFVSGDTASLQPIRAVKILADPRHYNTDVTVEYFTVH